MTAFDIELQICQLAERDTYLALHVCVEFIAIESPHLGFSFHSQ